MVWREWTTEEWEEITALADKVRAGTYTREQVARQLERRELIAAEWLARGTPFEELTEWGQAMVTECRHLAAGYRAVLALVDGEESA